MVVENPDLLPQPRVKLEIESWTSGYVTDIDALEAGMASRILGAGRRTKDDTVDLSVGILLKKKIGDNVDTGEALAVFYSDGDDEKIVAAKNKFLDELDHLCRKITNFQISLK